MNNYDSHHKMLLNSYLNINSYMVKMSDYNTCIKILYETLFYLKLSNMIYEVLFSTL